MQDFCPIKRVDHLELYVGNAKQAATYYARSFGFSATGYRGLETGHRDLARADSEGEARAQRRARGRGSHADHVGGRDLLPERRGIPAQRRVRRAPDQ